MLITFALCWLLSMAERASNLRRPGSLVLRGDSLKSLAHFKNLFFLLVNLPTNSNPFTYRRYSVMDEHANHGPNPNRNVTDSLISIASG
ncbi:hypothetical protein EDC04DRAFT_2786982 [Pisolithus marmoratus]|nr:hypothetical protein EDC04DRAFT_2786982 [Pisolithus marmoratus]